MARKGRRNSKEGSDSTVATFFMKAGSKLLLGIVIVLAFLTLAQCTIKKPESPTWATQFTVPVVNRTYTMEELVDRVDQEGLQINDSGEVVFSITEELDTIGLDEDDLSTGDLSYVVSERLGMIDVEIPTLSPVTVTLGEISGLGLLLPGDSMLVPDTTFTVQSDLPAIGSFSSATISSGRMDVVITNALDLTLDNIVIELLDGSMSGVIASGMHAGAVPSGTSVSIPLLLDGALVPADMRLRTSYHTPQDTVRSASTRYIESAAVFGDTLQASSATARIPSLSRVDSALVSLAENDRIDAAVLESGTLQMTIENATNLDANVLVEAPDFRQGGQWLQINQPVSAQSVTNVNVNLAGYTLAPASSVVPQQVAIVATASMPGSGVNQIAVDQADSFVVNASVSNLTFSSVTGLFQSVSATFDGISEELDVPTGLESVEFVNAIVTLEIENGIDLPGQIDVRFDGNNGKSTAFVGDIAPRGLATSVTTTVVNDSAAAFLAPLPSQIDVSGSVTFGDGSYLGTITRGGFVWGRVTVLAPLEMVINPSTVETEIESEEIDQEDIEVITEHFIEGRFVYQITSHLPIGAYVNVYLGGDSASLFTSPEVRFDSLYMTAAPVGIGGIVSDTAQTGWQEIYLDSIDIKVLENPMLYIGHEILLEGSNGVPVKLTANDYLTITGRVEVEYLFDGEF